MYTVLEGLERPWMHSYAGELVIKICKACPELTRGLWSSVKAYLEPRATKTWLATVQFAERLLMELDPCCIEFCAKDLTISQVSYQEHVVLLKFIISFCSWFKQCSFWFVQHQY